VHGQAGGCFLLDRIQELHELDATMPRSHAADNLAGGHVERGE
jgi:hypothetical protein